MLVSELKELLKKYQDDDSLVVAIWDKDCFQALNTEERLVTDKDWADTCEWFVMQEHDQMLGAKIREHLETAMSTNDVKALHKMNTLIQEMRDEYENNQLWDKE